MRKKVKMMAIAVIAAIGCATGIKAVTSVKEVPMSLTMSNVEALSGKEVKTFLYVVVVHYEKGDGCNCAGTGEKLCCYY